MSNYIQRKPHTISISERELTFVRAIMYRYNLKSLSETIRMLIVKEYEAMIQDNGEVLHG